MLPRQVRIEVRVVAPPLLSRTGSAFRSSAPAVSPTAETLGRPPATAEEAGEGAVDAGENVGETFSEVTNTWNGPVLTRRQAGAGGANNDAAAETETTVAEEKSTTGADAAGGVILRELPRSSTQSFLLETAGVELCAGKAAA